MGEAPEPIPLLHKIQANMIITIYLKATGIVKRMKGAPVALRCFTSSLLYLKSSIRCDQGHDCKIARSLTIWMHIQYIYCKCILPDAFNTLVKRSLFSSMKRKSSFQYNGAPLRPHFPSLHQQMGPQWSSLKMPWCVLFTFILSCKSDVQYACCWIQLSVRIYTAVSDS